MALKPLEKYAGGSYPGMGRRLAQGLFLAAAMSATTLGGCGPAIDSHTLDATLDSGDLDATAEECDGDEADCASDAAD